MALMNMFWVYKDFFRSRGTQCILNQGRTTHKKNVALQGGQLWLFSNQGKIKPKSNQKFSFFSVRVFADFTSMKNFLWHLWTCSEYVKVFSEGGEHNAFESVTYDTKKKNGALQYEQLWLFWNQVRNVHLSAFSEGVCWLYVDEKNFYGIYEHVLGM